MSKRKASMDLEAEDTEEAKIKLELKEERALKEEGARQLIIERSFKQKQREKHVLFIQEVKGASSLEAYLNRGTFTQHPSWKRIVNEKEDQEIETETEETNSNGNTRDDKKGEESEEEIDLNVGDFIEIKSTLWKQPYVARYVGYDQDREMLSLEWYYHSSFINKDGNQRLTKDSSLKDDEVMMVYEPNVVIRSFRKRTQLVSVESVKGKCLVVDFEENLPLSYIRSRAKKAADAAAASTSSVRAAASASSSAPIYFCPRKICYDESSGCIIPSLCHD